MRFVFAQTTATTTPVRPSSNSGSTSPSNLSDSSNSPTQFGETAAQLAMPVASVTSSSSLGPTHSTAARQTAAVSATSDSRNSPALSSETATQVAMTTARVSSSSSLDLTRSTAARQIAAVAAIRTSPPTPATTPPAPCGKLTINKSDILSTLTLTDSRTQDVPEVTILFR